MSGLLDGVLPWIFSQGDTMKRNLRGNVRSLLEDPRGYAQSISQDIAAENARKSQAAKALLYPSVMDEQGQQQAMQAMTETALNLLAPTVYHGSPHKFDRFDSSKIGTGEGAQAYGHGLYFADQPGTAQWYAESLAGKQYAPSDLVSANGVTLKELMKDAPPLARAKVTSYVNNAQGDMAKASADFDAFVQQQIRDNGALTDAGRAVLSEAQGWMRKLADAKISFTPKPTGNLYKVDLPDDMAAKMLDWDKPLSQQAGLLESARNAMHNGPQEALRMDVWVRDNPNATGGDLIKQLERLYGVRYANESLSKAGIPGIRYLDAGSRGAGKGSYNYVVFPGGESQLKILERNGKGLLDR